jgi:hypothetical protein
MLKSGVIGLLASIVLAGCANQPAADNHAGGVVSVGFSQDQAMAQATEECGKKGKVPRMTDSNYQIPQFKFDCVAP